MPRVAALLLLLSAAVAAGNDERRVRELVPLLGSKDADLRQEAVRRLYAMGEEVIPLLQTLSSKDPEISRALRALIRRSKRLRIFATGPTGPQRIGTVIKIRVRLVNHTDDTYIVPLVHRAQAIRGTKSAFAVKVHGATPRRLQPDEVELLTQAGRHVILPPEAVLQVEIGLTGADPALRAPGRVALSVLYQSKDLASALLDGNRVTEMNATPELLLESRPITIEAVGTKPADLDAALRSKDPDVFGPAVAELQLRDDDAVLPVLRAHMGNPRLRLRAVRRLGRAAQDGDLALFRSLSALKGEALPVRLAAVEALGNYPGRRRAQVRLVTLAQDDLLRDAAVKALVKHRSALSIDCFVRLLQRNYHEGEWTADALRAILEWTDKHVENRRGEIDAFERWWIDNRTRWISREASRGR